MSEPILLNRQTISSLPVPQVGKRAYFYDSKVRGLAISILSSGVKSFLVYRKINGRPVKITLGRFSADLPDSRELTSGANPLELLGNMPELNVKMARTLATAVNAQLDLGTNPSEVKRKERKDASGELTLRKAFDLYVSEFLVPHGKKSVSDIQDNFARYLGEVPPGQKKLRGRERKKPACAVNWEKRKLSSIDQSEIRRLMSSINEEIGPTTANRTFELLRAIYNANIRWKYYSGDNPCQGILKFKLRSRERFLTGNELPTFLNCLATFENSDFKDYILLCLTTGARKSNVLSMKWSDIDFDARIWAVPGLESKNGDSMSIPLTAHSLEVLKRRQSASSSKAAPPLSDETPPKKASDWVFPAAKSKSGHMEDPKKHWASLIKSSGLQDIRLHDLRRSLGSWAAMSGASLAIIGQALGHKSSEATLVYARLQADPVRDAMQTAIDNMFARAGLSSTADIFLGQRPQVSNQANSQGE